jgi:F-type H+-transporting ATPase subunit a
MSIYDSFDAWTGLALPHEIWAAALATILLIAMGFALRSQLAAANGGILPDEGVTLRNIVELIVEQLVNLAKDTMGDEYRTWFPVCASIFFFVLISNVMGLVPGLGGSTSSINVTIAWGIISFIAYNAAGLRKHGFWYINQFLGPGFFEFEMFGRHWHARLLAPVFFVLEVPLHFARILTLGIRLLANMFADHQVVAVWLGLVPAIIPAIFMGLGLMVAVLQAFVFSLLTMIYIGLALEEAH